MNFLQYNPFNAHHILTNHELDLFLELLNLNSEWLDNHLNDLIKHAEKYPKEFQEEMFLDDVITARDDLPNLTYSGLFVSLFSFIEDNMRQFAVWSIPDDILSLKKIREVSISDISSQLLKQGAMNNRPVFCNEFFLIRQLRNACNHSGARLDCKGLESYRSLRNRKQFSDLSIDINSGQIEFTADFLRATIDWAKECLEEMANDLAKVRYNHHQDKKK